MFSRNLTYIAVLVLLLFNAYVIYIYGLDVSRWARLFTTIAFLLILFLKENSGKKIIAVFTLLLSSDILLFVYETALGNAGTFLLRIAAYLMIIYLVVPELRNLKANIFQRLIFLVVFSLNFGMLYMLVDMIPPKFEYSFSNFLFYIYGISMMLMVIAAVSYSNRFSNKISFYYTAAVLCLVFSDITSFIAYYLGFSEFYYPDRIFYIIGVAALVKFSAFERDHQPAANLESL